MKHNFGYSASLSVAIEEKLNKEDTEIDSLLEEDEIIQEMKNQNQKLVN